jgi:translocation and assembly module TamB
MNRPNQQLQGELELHANASGPLNQPYEMQAHAEVPNLKVAYRNFQLGNSLPIQIDYRNGAVALERTQLSGTGTNLDVQGLIPVGTTAPASFAANGTVDLGILQLFSPDITSSGRLELAVNALGAKSNPGIQGMGVQGQIKIVNATLATTAAPIGIEGLNGTLLVENNRLEIKEFVGDAGGGRISATGFIGYRPSLAFNVALNAEHVRLLYPDGVRTVFNSNLLLEGTPDASNLSGRVLLDSLSFTPSFDLATFMSQSGEGSSGTASAGPAQNLHLDVALQSAGDLQVVSSQLSLEGQVNLRVLGTAAQPVIVGRTDLTGGEVFFMNKRYQIERATAEFNNPNRTEPDLNVLVTTVIRQYNVSLNLVGPLDRLRTNYISDLPLPPVDIINLLALGKTTEEPSTGNLGANALLAQGLASQVGGQVQKLAGISSLQIDPLIGANNPSARLAIQQRVTKDFFFTFSTDVTSTQDQVVQGEYQISNRWSVSAMRNENGNIGVDAKFHSSF